MITSPTATPGTLGPGQSKITLGAHVTDNVGVTLVSIGVYEKGQTDATIDGAFYSLGLSQGDNKNGQYVGDYTFADSVPDGEYQTLKLSLVLSYIVAHFHFAINLKF